MDDDGEPLKCMPNLSKCTNLTFLDLYGVGDLECKRIAESPLRHLKDLTLTADVGDEGCKYIASSPYLRNLKTLNLGYNNIGDVGLKYLSNSENMDHLKYLLINNCNYSSEGIRALSLSPHFSNLKHLDLIGMDMTSEVCELLTHLTHLKKLSLDISIPSQSLSILCSNLHLTHLVFSGVEQFSDDSCRVLAQSPHLSNLKVVNLQHNYVSGAGFEILANSPYLTNLKKLSVVVSMLNEQEVRSIVSNSTTFCGMDVTANYSVFELSR